jgi:hypothetical protein
MWLVMRAPFFAGWRKDVCLRREHTAANAKVRQYHRPIDSPQHLGSNGSATDFALHVHERGNMDHNEAVRKFEHLMLKQADHAQEAASELEALVSLLPNEKSRQLAQLQAKASHKQAKDFRELAQKVKES